MSKKRSTHNQSQSRSKEHYEPIWPLSELRQHFASIELPKSFKLNDWTFIDDVPGFVESHLQVLRQITEICVLRLITIG
jgi:hypothetical protein